MKITNDTDNRAASRDLRPVDGHFFADRLLGRLPSGLPHEGLVDEKGLGRISRRLDRKGTSSYDLDAVGFRKLRINEEPMNAYVLVYPFEKIGGAIACPRRHLLAQRYILDACMRPTEKLVFAFVGWPSSDVLWTIL